MICRPIKKSCQQAIDCPNHLLAKEIEKTTPQFITAVKELLELNDKISKEEWTLCFATDTAKNVCETELIHFINQLTIYGRHICICICLLQLDFKIM